MNKREYSDDEAQEILKRAVTHQDGEAFKYDQQELLDVGRELGLSQDAMVKAEQEMHQGKPASAVDKLLGLDPLITKNLRAEEAAFQRERLAPFKQHVVVFLAAIPLLIILNMLTSGFAFMWALIAIAGWGMGLVGYYMTVGRMEGDDYETELAKWKHKRQRK